MAQTIQAHQLQDNWVFWLRNHNKNSSDDWGRSQSKCYNFKSIENFWCLINNMINPFELKIPVDYFIFKEGINPDYSDATFAKGGRIVYKIANYEKLTKNELFELYILLLASVIGNNYDDPKVTTCAGVRLNLGRSKCKIEIWCTHSDENVLRCIGTEFAKRMSESCKNIELLISFSAFDNSKEFNILFHNSAS